MTAKRVILIVLTVLVLFKVTFSLLASFNQPQVQSRLELYQTNLILHASEFVPPSNEQANPKVTPGDSTTTTSDLTTALIGNKPYQTAQAQYEKVIDLSEKNLALLEAQWQKQENLAREQQTPKAKVIADTTSTNTIDRQLKQAIELQQKSLDELHIKIGILQAEQGNLETAQKTWQKLTTKVEIASILQGLWSESPQVAPTALDGIKTNLDGWFRYRALKQFYEIQQAKGDLVALDTKEQEMATAAVVKLIVIGSIPLLGGILGVVLLLGLLVDLLLKKERSLLATNNSLAWETPWDGEIIWQVLIVGFFFIGEILLPLLFGLVGFNPTGFSLRLKAVYVLVSYLMMAGGGLLVLYFSLKPFFPLPQDWFRFKLQGNWILWGIGGYLVALPLVVIVSLVNQQLWHGQGGSNPLLSLALESQDALVLGIFFTTASIAAPVFEEIVFRGFLLTSLTRYLPVSGAIFVSSLIFATAHLSVSEILPLTTLGMVLGFVYTRSRNLLAPMLVHCLWNSGTLISLFVLGSGG